MRVLISGTDTGVGKTTISTMLLRAAAMQGIAARGMKPIASGAERIDGVLRNSDAQALREASHGTPDYSDVNPYCFELHVAPHIAQGRERGPPVDWQVLKRSATRLATDTRLFLVEGAGGFLSPLGHAASPDGTLLEHADLVSQLALDGVLIVVGLRLGCLNHARLTELAIAHANLRCFGVVLSVLDANMPALQENIESLHTLLHTPILGVVDQHAAHANVQINRVLSLMLAAHVPA